MDEDSDSAYTFTEMLQPDDPRLKQLLDIPEEENRSSFCATIQLVSGSNELEIEDVSVWNCCHLTNEDFNRLQAIAVGGEVTHFTTALLYRAATADIGSAELRCSFR